MIDGKKVLAITIAKGVSERVPRKNMVDVNGHPLLWWTINEVKKSKYIDRYIVSTEDHEIQRFCWDHGVEYWEESQELVDKGTSADVVLATAKDAHELTEDVYDYVVEVMCTNPLKTHVDIDGVIEKLNRTEADSVVSVVRVWDHHPSRIKFIKDDRLIDVYPEVPESRRQELTPPAYVRNGSIYATTYDSLIKTSRRLGKDTRPYEMPQERTVNIDELMDLEMARLMLKARENETI